jgi:translation initiation factor IF-1
VTRRQFIAVTIMLAVPALAVAHPGHAHKTMGVVTVIHENHLEVKDAEGKAITFTLDAKTRIRRGKIADIKTGDRVVVVSNESKGKDGKATVTVTEVQLGAAQ